VAIVHRRLAHYRLPLYRGLLEQNPDLRLSVYCGPDGGVGTSGVALDEDDPGFVRRVRTHSLGWNGRGVIVQPGALWRLARRPPAVVVLEGRILLTTTLLLLLWRRLTGRKSILWLKGWPSEGGTSSLSRFIRRRYLALADGYIVYGEAGRDWLARYGVPPSTVTVVQNTVDVARLLETDVPDPATADDARVRCLLEAGDDFVLNIGRLVRKKAVEDVLEAFALLRADPARRCLRLVVAGRGPRSGALEERARALGLGESVLFTGRVSERDAELLFRSARACAFPGAVGLALNEAMAAGRAVVCADEPGPDSELLVHEQSGLRYPKGDVAALADSLRLVLDDDVLAAELGRRARETIRRRATMSNMIEQYGRALRRASAPAVSRNR